jgi:hypothetical protein
MSFQIIDEAAGRFARMSKAEKLQAAIGRSAKYMPAETWEMVKQFLSPESLSIMVAITTGWAVSHFFGVGEIADVVLLALGAATLGASAWHVGKNCVRFAQLVSDAQSDEEIEQAGRLFANMVLELGVTTVSTIFMLKRPVVFDRPFINGPLPPQPPRTPGLFYKPPPAQAVPMPPRVNGVTTFWGDIYVNITKPAWV